MPEVNDTHRKLKIAFAALGVADVVAAIVLFSPLVGSATARKDQINALWKDMQLKTRQVEPLRGLDSKVANADKDIDKFYKQRLPDRDSAISEALGRITTQNGVKIEHIKYETKDELPVELYPVMVEASFSGGYLQLAKFINSLEREQLFFIVDSVELGGEQGGIVKLQMKLETYLKIG